MTDFTFPDCVEYCLSQKELIEQYNRLTGSKIGVKSTPTALETLIDESCGYTPGLDEKEYFKFFEFVRDVIWTRLPAEAFAD
jgi:hypothetical protein